MTTQQEHIRSTAIQLAMKLGEFTENHHLTCDAPIFLNAGYAGQFKILIAPDGDVILYEHVEFEQGRWRWERIYSTKT